MEEKAYSFLTVYSEHDCLNPFEADPSLFSAMTTKCHEPWLDGSYPDSESDTIIYLTHISSLTDPAKVP